MNSPNLFFEKRLWKNGFRFIAGADEVGRGSFAGPIVAAAVVFAPISNFKFLISNEKGRRIIINDSKKLTPKQRQNASKWIKKNALAYGVGSVSAKVINGLGMAKAARMAFRRAISSANRKLNTKNLKSIEFLLIDAFYVPYVKRLRRKNQLAIINGDEKSIAIAAASIVAKVYRDALMEKIGSGRKYKKYGWIENKGYGTKIHREAILKYGITGYHRKKFVETLLVKLKN